MVASLTDAPLDAAEEKTRRFKQLFPLLLMTMGVAALDQQIVNTALPRISADLGQLQHLSWVLTAFMLAQTVTMPLYGKLSDLYGRKRLLIISISIFLAGSALCSLSQSMVQLILFRAIQGLGGGGLFTLVSAIIGDFLSPRERGRYSGYTTAVFAVCTIAGPLAGGLLTSTLGWRAVFWINLPLAGGVLAMLIAKLPSGGTRVSHKVDILGAGLVAVGAVPLLLALSWGGVDHAWSSPLILGLLTLAVLATVALIAQERRAPEPILALDLFEDRTMRWGGATGAIIGFAYFGSIVFLPLFFQVVAGFSPTQAGMMIVPQIAGNLIASIYGGRRISNTGRYRNAIVAGGIGLAAFFLILGMLARQAAPIWAVEVCLFFLGLSGNTCILAINLGVQNAVPLKRLGAAISSTSFLNALAGSAGIAMAGAIMNRRLQAALTDQGVDPDFARHAIGKLAAGAHGGIDPHMLEQAYRMAISSAFLVSGLVAGLAIVTALLTPDHALRSGEAPGEPAAAH
ncbi:MDR family MFS transporter [Phenylobacterium aquaticum]|uniref:MDR family MFS transporter n=1 Tax=Phenylobacterium aquaticum TaxID=1763816 RepID=UPI0026EE93A1|nr:MDR family MFS transporter [Phenylobacterium aquaticum]